MIIKQLFKENKIWTLSNFLSFSRILIGGVLYYFILNHETSLAISMAIVAIITDYADGYFARKRNEVSELGKVLDPVADKVTVGLGSIGLYHSYDLPLLVVILILGRDVLIVLGSLILFKKMERVTASAFPGKLAVTVISLLLLAYLVEFKFLQKPFMILAIISILYSFFYYARSFFRELFLKRPIEE